MAVDRDEVLLIEDWRLKADGSAIVPGQNADGTIAAWTVNGQTALNITAKAQRAHAPALHQRMCARTCRPQN
jgi:hypothetical protein